MNKISLFFLFAAYLGYSQSEVKENFILENDHVFWQKVFPREKIQADSLKNLFEAMVLPKLKYSKLDKNANQLSAQVEDDAIDYKKYGGRNLSTGVFAKQAHLYYFSVEFKDERYRVTISQIQNIDSNVNSINEPFEEAVSKNGSTFYSSKLVEKGLEIMNTYFTLKFTIPQIYKPKESDW